LQIIEVLAEAGANLNRTVFLRETLAKIAEGGAVPHEEHLAELLAVPGVLNAARYEAVSSSLKHLARYELESPAVIETDAFKNRQPTERSLRAGHPGAGTNLISNFYEMIYPADLTDEIANSDTARMALLGSGKRRSNCKSVGRFQVRPFPTFSSQETQGQAPSRLKAPGTASVSTHPSGAIWFLGGRYNSAAAEWSDTPKEQS